MVEHENLHQEFSFKHYFVPFTNLKAIHWIVIIGLVVFSNMLFNGFVWDDKTFIQFNPDMLHLNIPYLFGPNMFNNINAGQYRSFIALYFTVLHSLFGDVTFFYHVFQLVIHILNTLLLFYLFKRFFKRALSFFLALLFLVHPMQVESVSFIASSDNPLFTLFGLLALNGSMIDNPTTKRTVLIFSLLLLSLLSKETGFFFIVLVVLSRSLFMKTNKLLYAICGVITFLVYLFMRFVIADVYFSKVTLAPITRLSFSERLVTIPAVLFYYLKTFFLPIHLMIIQYWVVTKVDFFHFYLPLLFDSLFGTLVVVFGVYLRKKQKKTFAPYLFFCIWLLLGFGLYSQVFALDMTVADRWFYFPFIGLLGIIGFFLHTVGVHFQKRQKWVWIMGIGILCLFSLRTIVRNTNWQDPITLYAHDSNREDNFELENSLGGELNSANRRAEALIHFKKSVALFPHETNLFNLGLWYEQTGDSKNAEKYYSDAFNVENYNLVPFPNKRLEVIYIRYAGVVLQHNPKKALKIINEEIADYPNDPKAWYIKAECEYLLHNRAEALHAAKNTYDLLPTNASVMNLYNSILNNQSISITP